MSQMNVEQFASELGVLPTVLLEQLRAAGIRKHLTEDSLTENDKAQLLEYLRKIHGAKEAKGRISLPRRQTAEIKKSDSTGKARSSQVEVRKKRVFVKGDLAAVSKPAEAAVPSAPSAVPPIPAPTPVIDAAQQALREEEARRQAELIARQTAELREKQQRQKPAADVKEAEPAVPATGAAAAAPEPAPVTAAGAEAIPSAAQAGEAAQPQVVPTEGTLHKPVVKPE